jgi:hypothetical protein
MNLRHGAVTPTVWGSELISTGALYQGTTEQAAEKLMARPGQGSAALQRRVRQ